MRATGGKASGTAGTNTTTSSYRPRRTVYLVFATVFVIAIVEAGLQLAVQQRAEEAIESSTYTVMVGAPSRRLPSLIDVVFDGDSAEEAERKKPVWRSIVSLLEKKQVLVTRLAMLKMNEPHWRGLLLDRVRDGEEDTLKKKQPRLRVTINRKTVSRSLSNDDNKEASSEMETLLSNVTNSFYWWLPCLPYQYPRASTKLAFTTTTASSAVKQPLRFAIIATMNYDEISNDGTQQQQKTSSGTHHHRRRSSSSTPDRGDLHFDKLWSTLNRQTYPYWKLFFVVYNHPQQQQRAEINNDDRKGAYEDQDDRRLVTIRSSTTDWADAMNAAIDLAQEHNLTHVIPLDGDDICHQEGGDSNEDTDQQMTCWSSNHLLELAEAYLDFPDAVVVYASKAPRDPSSSNKTIGGVVIDRTYNQNNLFISSSTRMSWRMDRLPRLRYRTSFELSRVVGSNGDSREDLRDRITNHLFRHQHLNGLLAITW